MKKFLFLITLYSLLNTTADAQWWVSGGNLLWPYGNVTINKDLNVEGAINGAKSYVFLFSHDEGTGNPTVIDLFNNIGSHTSWIRVSVGSYRTTFTDVTFNNNKVFNTSSSALGGGDDEFHYHTYTSGSYLYISFNAFSTFADIDPIYTRLPISIIYYP